MIVLNTTAMYYRAGNESGGSTTFGPLVEIPNASHFVYTCRRTTYFRYAIQPWPIPVPGFYRYTKEKLRFGAIYCFSDDCLETLVDLFILRSKGYAQPNTLYVCYNGIDMSTNARTEMVMSFSRVAFGHPAGSKVGLLGDDIVSQLASRPGWSPASKVTFTVYGDIAVYPRSQLA